MFITVFTRARCWSLLSQIDPVHTTPSYFFQINLNVILPPTFMSFYWCLSFWLSHQNSKCIPLIPMYATCPANPPSLQNVVIIFVEVYELSQQSMARSQVGDGGGLQMGVGVGPRT
jgi:hypothetical protein